MKVRDFEKKVWEQDQIRIVIRANSQDEVGSYGQKKAAQGNWRIKEFLKKRIKPLVKGKEIVVIERNGEIAHGKKLLKSYRESYN
jgi:hypothetical protein